MRAKRSLSTNVRLASSRTMPKQKTIWVAHISHRMRFLRRLGPTRSLLSLTPQLSEHDSTKALRASWRETFPRDGRDTSIERVHPAGPASRANRGMGKSLLQEKTILLTCEQGLGDTIQFVRYAELVKNQGAKVHLEVQPPLKRLLSNVRYASSVVAVGETLPNHDLHCSLRRLPFAFKLLPTETSQNSAASVARWHRSGEGKAAASQGNRVEFNQQAATPAIIGRWRHSTCAWAWSPSASRQPSAVTPADSATLALHPEIKDLSKSLNDFTDTAAIISELDLVISVDSAVAHLAGAMGKPVWILLAFSPDWRWMLGRLNSPWYPTARLFRQTQFGDWNSVLSKLGEALKEKISDISR